MLGLLPTTLDVAGRSYAIRTDFRIILQIISAINDADLTDAEKVYVCLRLMYVRFDEMPQTAYADAYDAAARFIECGDAPDKQLAPRPKVIDWEHDEQMIFAAVNKVAGTEVRAMPHVHWWTFLGWFQSIDRDDIFAYVLGIRQKRATGRSLDKSEREFFNANRAMCDINHKDRKQEAEDYLAALFAELSKEEGGAH